MSPASLAAGFAGEVVAVAAAGLEVAGGAEFGLDATVDVPQPLADIANVAARNSHSHFLFFIAAFFLRPSFTTATMTKPFATTIGTAIAKSHSQPGTIHSGTIRRRPEPERAPAFRHERALPN